MAANRIDEIRAREQAATPGHWGTAYDGKGTYTVQAQPKLIPGVGNVDSGVVATLSGEHGDGKTYSNARFAAHAREDIPFLLDRVAELQELVKQLADPDPCWFDHHGHCQAHGWPYAEPSCPDGRANEMFPPAKEGE